MANEQIKVPLFAASEILTAANMNLSAGTGVPVFATTVTRDAGFGGAGEKVLAEGQLCYLSASNIVQYYDGAAWATVGPSGSVTAAYTPTITSFTLGNGTLSFTSTTVGKLVLVRGSILFGSTTSITGTPSFTYPVTAAAFYGAQSYFGNTFILDSGVAAYSGMCVALSTTAFEVSASLVNGTYASQNAINATTPMTWTTNDKLLVSFVYEAA